MNLEDGMKRISGVVEVEIEGFFTERYINLCKINNIRIWDVFNVTSGVIRFKVCIKDFKKLKKISKKTKCKQKIISKKGVYFKLFKYRKRKMLFLLGILALCICIYFSNVIWSIDIVGNENISTEELRASLKESGLYVGKSKFNIDTKKVITNLRIEIKDIAWAGVSIDGTKAYVKVVEKTKLPLDQIEEKRIGDILADKEGIIEKITVYSGTNISNVGDYVEKDRILIEGRVYSKFMEPKDVTAKGEIILRTNYTYENTYNFISYEKVYREKNKYSIGIDFNGNEKYINYLDKSKNYDIIKSGKNINIFSLSLGVKLYKFMPYDLKEIKRSEEELIELCIKEANEYIENDIIPTLNDASIIDYEVSVIEKDEEKIKINVKFNIKEKVGYFKERDNNEQN